MCGLALAALAPLVGACSSSLSDLSLNKPAPFRSDWLSFSSGQDRRTLRPVTAEDLVSAEGQCAATAAEAAANPEEGGPAAAAPALVAGGISLQMTECDVVRRAGAPERVELGSNEGRERSVVLTYSRGPRPGIYRFADGRLVSIERGAEPPAPAKQQRPAKAAKKKPAGA